MLRIFIAATMVRLEGENGKMRCTDEYVLTPLKMTLFSDVNVH